MAEVVRSGETIAVEGFDLCLFRNRSFCQRNFRGDGILRIGVYSLDENLPAIGGTADDSIDGRNGLALESGIKCRTFQGAELWSVEVTGRYSNRLDLLKRLLVAS